MTRKYHQPCPRSSPLTMCIVTAQRLASAAVVSSVTTATSPNRLNFVTSRRRLPLPRKPSASCATSTLATSGCRLARLQQQVADLQAQVSKLQAQRPFRVLAASIPTSRPSSPAPLRPSVGLPVAAVSAACLSRPAHAQRRRPGSPHPAGRSLRRTPVEVLDQQARPRPPGRRGRNLLLAPSGARMVVEPQSLCWLSGRCPPAATAPPQASRFPATTALEHGAMATARVWPTAWRRSTKHRGEHQPVIGDRETDHFHVAGKAVASCGKPMKTGPNRPGGCRKPTKWLNKTARVKH